MMKQAKANYEAVYVATPADGDDYTWHSERTQDNTLNLANVAQQMTDYGILLHEQRAEITALKRELAAIRRTMEQWRADD